ncbi:serine/threonine protein kinase [Actinomadura namibiensis]|uniref:non-specific serine/threonine protein kinase n=1 Tax=Actinomadura namibiensis TaxID=182080 RepID=A0A7W3LNL5_ACTNM|nr:serine/threonine-protein kinase [Actinomadura namibiensis]MBA8951453.1 serine/threonine protein kinase [Actinomadura namibiensis]
MGEGRLLAARYRLDAVVGRGGMGTVWRAHDLMLDREVAVKEVVLPPGLTDSERDVLIERTFREARASARLNHPGVVTVHDVVEEDGSPWIVMELVRARSLQDLLEEGPLAHRRVAEIGLQMLGALRHAHEKGILHRDVKPSNVLITDSGRVVLTDFGIAQMEGDATLTQTGLVMGSPAYIPPERAQGQRAVPASDLWALGATLYAALEGRSPYERSDAMSSLQAALVEPVPPPRNAGPLARVLEGLLAREPVHRMTAAQAEPLLTRVATMPAPVVPPTVADARAEALTSADETVLDETMLDEPSGRRRPDIAAETILDATEIAPYTRRDPESTPNRRSGENRPAERRSTEHRSNGNWPAGQGAPGVDPEARTVLESQWSAGPGPRTPEPWEQQPSYQHQWQQPPSPPADADRERRKTTVIVTAAVVVVVLAVLIGAFLLRTQL